MNIHLWIYHLCTYRQTDRQTYIHAYANIHALTHARCTQARWRAGTQACIHT